MIIVVREKKKGVSMKGGLREFAMMGLLMSAVLLSGCGSVPNDNNKPDAAINEESLSSIVCQGMVSKDSKFDSANINYSQAEFEELGFELGDSVNLSFSNGYSMEDLPYYNGYYVRYGGAVLVAYPGFDSVAVTYNCAGIWEKADLSDGMAFTITLNEKGKYKNIQESLGQIYSFVREDYSSDEEFCNYRACSGGKLKSDFIYRGASPVDNSRGRAAYTDGLLKASKVGRIVDLADSKEDIVKYRAMEDYASAYTDELLDRGNVILLNMGSSYRSDEYKKSIADGLREIIASDEPVYIHCMEGKDRTGFVCMLIEALSGASYDEMLKDYMITYDNYYSINQTDSPETYDKITDIYFNEFMEYLHGAASVEELKTSDYTEAAKNYLLEGGMTETEIEALINTLTI